MNTRLMVAAVVVVALTTVGVVGHHIENANNAPPATAVTTGPDWTENVLADTSEQQTALDNLYADAQLQDARAVARDCLAVQDSLGGWTSDEAGISDLSIRTTYTNVVLKLSQAVAVCNSDDIVAISNLVDAADTYLNATVAAVQARGSGG
jgi:hypothetical protein